MLSAQDSGTLRAIHRAGAAGGDWSVMLVALAERMQASNALVLTSQGIWDQHGARSDLVLVADWGMLRPGRVYSGEELAFRRLPEQALPPAQDIRAIGLQGAGALDWLVLLRARGAFQAVDSARLAAFAPHVADALTLARRLQGLELRAMQAETIARRMHVGLVWFDGAGRVCDLDAVAAALLEAAGLSRGAVAAQGPGVLELTGGLELLCRARPDGTQMGYLRARRQPLPAPARLAQLFCLTLSEARLLRALGEGATLREAAAQLGLTQETARSYSKQIFTKTGTRGQSDLMRRLWAGVAVLG